MNFEAWKHRMVPFSAMNYIPKYAAVFTVCTVPVRVDEKDSYPVT